MDELFNDKFIIDTGNDIVRPKNYVRIEVKEEQDMFGRETVWSVTAC